MRKFLTSFINKNLFCEIILWFAAIILLLCLSAALYATCAYIFPPLVHFIYTLYKGGNIHMPTAIFLTILLPLRIILASKCTIIPVIFFILGLFISKDILKAAKQGRANLFQESILSFLINKNVFCKFLADIIAIFLWAAVSSLIAIIISYIGMICVGLTFAFSSIPLPDTRASLDLLKTIHLIAFSISLLFGIFKTKSFFRPLKQ